MNEHRRNLLQIAGAAAIVGPMLVLGSDLMHIFLGHDFLWTILLWAGMLLVVLGVLGLAYLCIEDGSRLAYLGGALAYFGAFAGGSMQVLFRVHAVLAEQGNMQAVESLKNTFKLVASTQMIGLAYPVGLILLAISYYRHAKSRSLVPPTLVMGAILFPIGRISGAEWAVIGSGIFIMIAFVMIGLRLVKGDVEPNRVAD